MLAKNGVSSRYIYTQYSSLILFIYMKLRVEMNDDVYCIYTCDASAARIPISLPALFAYQLLDMAIDRIIRFFVDNLI